VSKVASSSLSRALQLIRGVVRTLEP